MTRGAGREEGEIAVWEECRSGREGEERGRRNKRRKRREILVVKGRLQRRRKGRTCGSCGLEQRKYTKK